MELGTFGYQRQSDKNRLGWLRSLVTNCEDLLLTGSFGVGTKSAARGRSAVSARDALVLRMLNLATRPATAM
jgi:hypothetical protein